MARRTASRKGAPRSEGARGIAVAIGLALGIGVAIAFGALGIGSSGAHAESRSAASRTAQLFVSAREFSLSLSRGQLEAGPATVQLYNAGEHPHDLRLKRVGGSRVVAVAETQPGGVTQIKAVLHSGTWKLWCSLPGHAKRGMRAKLIVRR